MEDEAADDDDDTTDEKVPELGLTGKTRGGGGLLSSARSFLGVRHTKSTVRRASRVHEEFAAHELGLKKKQERQSILHKQNVLVRVAARLKIKKAKALAKVSVFSGLGKDAQDAVLEAMTYEKRKAGDVICRQGDCADTFYVIVSGQCSVTVHSDGGEDDAEEIAVASLPELSFFGESSISGGANETRNATVVADAEKVELLKLHRSKYELLVREGTLAAAQVETLREVQRSRQAETEQKRGAVLQRQAEARLGSSSGAQADARSLFS
jgi:CRP-like cAMP-binding protein